MNIEEKNRLPFGIRGSFRGFPIRTRIILAILLTFVLVLPVVAMSLFYFSDLLSAIQAITEQDVKLGRMATSLTSSMFDIQRLERNYRIFGSAAEKEGITRLIARTDSLIESARTITPEGEQDIVNELDRRLSGYRSGFAALASYLDNNPPSRRMQHIRSKLLQQYSEFESLFQNIQSRLETAAPAQRDSILADANKYIDVFSFDRILTLNDDMKESPQSSFIQQNIDAARRDFLLAAQRFATVNWEKMEVHKEEALRIEARAKRNIIFIIMVTAIFCIFIIVKLPRYLIKPVTNLSSILRKAADGELDTHAAVTSQDEIGELAATYNQAIDRIRAYDELKTKKIATQKRSIERLIEYMNAPICILSKNLAALYYNSAFSSIFGASLPQKAPENGCDIAKLEGMRDFTEQLRKKIAQGGGDFHFTVVSAEGSEVSFKGRPVRNAALVLETIIVIGAANRDGKNER